MSNSGVRIIPLDGRPHLASSIRQWPGDSRGPLFEYACHEGNHDLANILEIARNIH